MINCNCVGKERKFHELLTMRIQFALLSKAAKKDHHLNSRLSGGFSPLSGLARFLSIAECIRSLTQDSFCLLSTMDPTLPVLWSLEATLGDTLRLLWGNPGSDMALEGRGCPVGSGVWSRLYSCFWVCFWWSVMLLGPRGWAVAKENIYIKYNYICTYVIFVAIR